MLALTTPRVSCRVDIAHRMIQATSADLPMPWPEAMATRTASFSTTPKRRSIRPLPILTRTSRCHSSGPVSPARGVCGMPQGKANMTKPRGS